MAILIFVTVAVWFVVYGVPNLRKWQRLRFEKVKQGWRNDAFLSVKSGGHSVRVSDLALLPMLANDADCVHNLDDLFFSGLDISSSDAAHISRLKNLRSIGFYDCAGTNAVIAQCAQLQIQSLFFELADVSPSSIALLAKFPALTNIQFEQNLSDETIRAILALPPSISVKAHPMLVLSTPDESTEVPSAAIEAK